MSAPTDVTIKIYERGKFAGYLAMFFESEKAKTIAKKIEAKDNIIVSKKENLPRAEKICNDNRLHFEVVHMHGIT
jgi:hypothetical protein